MTPRSRQSKWTKEACAVEAKKYKSRAEFHKYSSGAYQISSNYRWLDEFFPVTKQNWTIDSLAAEASKYKTRTEFFQGSGSAYRFARAHNLLDSFCGHMITPCRQYKRSNEARAE
jgi:hypothetical protein